MGIPSSGLQPKDVPLSLSSSLFADTPSSTSVTSASQLRQELSGMHACAKEYDKKVHELSWGCWALKANEWMINASLDAIPQVVPPVNVAMSVMKATNQMFHNYFFSKCNQIAEDRALDFTASCIDSLQITDKSQGKQQVFTKAFELTQDTPAAQPLVLYHMSQVLENKWDTEFDALQNSQRDMRAEITQLKSCCGGMQELHAELSSRKTADITALKEATQSIHAKLDRWADDRHSTHLKQEFITEFIWGKMNPSEKLQAINKGYFQATQEEKELLKSQESFQKAVSTAVTAINTANTVVGLLGALGPKIGIPPEVTKVGTVAVQVGSIVTNVLTGNFLGALNGLGGLLGGGSDPAEQRHQEVMGHLNQLQQGQQQIFATLGNVMEAQKRTYETLVEGLRSVLDAQKRTLEAIQKIDQRLNRIESHQLFTIQVLAVTSAERAIPAKNFLRNRHLYMQRHRQYYANQTELLNHLNTPAARNDLNRGVRGLKSIFAFKIDLRTIPAPDIALLLYSDTQNSQQNLTLLNEYYGSILSYLHTFNTEEKHQAISLSLFPYKKLSQFDQSLAHEDLNEERLEFFEKFTTDKSHLLNPAVLYPYVKRFCKLIPYRILTQDNMNQLNATRIRQNVSNEGYKKSLKRELKDLMDIVDLAIAQTMMIQGIPLFNCLFQIFMNLSTTTSVFHRIFTLPSINDLEFRHVGDHLVDPTTGRFKNRFLEYNFSLYLIHSLLKKGCYTVDYAFYKADYAIHQQKEQPVAWMFTKQHRLSPIQRHPSKEANKGLFLKFGDKLFLPLPTPDQLAEGRFQSPNYRSGHRIYSLDHLIQLKIMIGQTLMDFTAHENLPGANPEILAHLQLEGLLLPNETRP